MHLNAARIERWPNRLNNQPHGCIKCTLSRGHWFAGAILEQHRTSYIPTSGYLARRLTQSDDSAMFNAQWQIRAGAACACSPWAGCLLGPWAPCAWRRSALVAWASAASRGRSLRAARGWHRVCQRQFEGRGHCTERSCRLSHAGHTSGEPGSQVHFGEWSAVSSLPVHRLAGIPRGETLFEVFRFAFVWTIHIHHDHNTHAPLSALARRKQARAPLLDGPQRAYAMHPIQPSAHDTTHISHHCL